MNPTPLYALSDLPRPLEEALAGRGFAVLPVRWDGERHALAPTAADAAALHLEGGGQDALQDRWVLAARGDPALPAASLYARCYGMRLAAVGGAGPEPDGAAGDRFVDRILADDGHGWTAAADALVRDTGLRRLCVLRGGAPASCDPWWDGLARGLAELGVPVVPVGGDAGWPEPMPGDWAVVPDRPWAAAPPAQALVEEARAHGFRIAFLCRGDRLPPWGTPPEPDRLGTLAALAGADAVLTDAEATAAALLEAGHRLLPKVNTLRWTVAACPPPERPDAQARQAHARAVAAALVRRAPVTWPAPVPDPDERRPLLSIGITTYNRCSWLAVSLRRVLERTRPYRDAVEVVVCDNASTDATPAVVARHAGEEHLRAHRNPANVGMLGNLAVTARLARGRFVWLIGDDDLLVDGAVEDVLEGILRHPDIHMAYLNYACTRLEAPASPEEEDRLIRLAAPVAAGGPNRHVPALRAVATLHENLFTAIYTCVFRRDHALLAYGQNVAGPPFSSLECSAPSAPYALKALLDRPAYWVGRPALVVNMNVSWKEHGLLWILERMPELCDLAERRGADPAGIDACRANLCRAAATNVHDLYFSAGPAVRRSFLLARLLERCKHLDDFRRYQVPLLRDVYRRAHQAGIAPGEPSPENLFARYGLSDG